MTEATVTPESYARWLQAQRPPLPWFLSLSETDQGKLAEQGAVHRIEASLDLARAIRSPDEFEEEMFADSDPEMAERMARRIAAKHVAEILGEPPQMAPQQPVVRHAPTMVGAVQKQQEDQEERIQTDAGARRFLGRLPDAALERGAR